MRLVNESAKPSSIEITKTLDARAVASKPASRDAPAAMPTPSFKRALAAIVLFGVSFAYVEAALVTYLRAIYDPIRARLYPDKPAGELLPLITLEQLKAEGPEHIDRLKAECVRELATLVMLGAAALAVCRNARQFFAGFMIAFGVWDIFYYGFLKLLIDWPASLLTWDILFLVPVPWVAPVLAPVLVSVSMIVAGTVILWRESVGRPLALEWPQWSAIAAGGAIIMLAFCWDFANISAGRDPGPFNWPLFAAGESLGLAAFLHSLWADRKLSRPAFVTGGSSS